jgi:hypothetical protein
MLPLETSGRYHGVMTHRWIGWVAVVSVLLACSSEETSNGGSGGSGASGASGGGGSGGATTSSGTGGSSVPVCPPTEPVDGSQCDPEHVGLSCEYDEGPVVICRGYYTCGGGTWAGLFPGCSSEVPAAANCPAEPPSGTCTLPEGLELCTYADGTHCGCSNCLGGPCGGPAEWVCAPPPGGGCPATAPNFGQPCSTEGLQCSYGSCALGTQGQRNCQGGIWLNAGVPCPE